MAADDFQSSNPDQGFPADLDSPSVGGNRPASGARRATPGEVLSQGFQGAQNAGDFLGLDVEFTGHQEPDAGSLDLMPPPGADPAFAGSAPEPYVPEPSPVDPGQDYSQSPSAFEYGEDLGSDEGFAVEEPSRAPSRMPRLVGTFVVVAALAGGGVYYGPRLYSQYFGGQATEVASNGSRTAARATRGSAGAGDASSAPTVTERAGSEAATTPADATDGRGPESSAGDTGSDAAGVDGSLAQATPTTSGSRSRTSAPAPGSGTEPQVGRGEDPAGDEGAVAVGSAAGREPGPANPANTVRKASFPNLDGELYDWASEDQLELIWRGSEVPLDAVSAPAKTLMPRVGNVRVFMNSGDVFQGRLYAVGQNRVWLDSNPGRIGLDGERVQRIELIPPDPDGTVASLDETSLAGTTRVRVRVPGGLLYGRVLKAEGDEVILVPDGGGRVRVKAGDVQELGSGRAIVVGR